MAGITTHVLNSGTGRPGAGMRIDFSVRDGDGWKLVKTVTTNADNVNAPPAGSLRAQLAAAAAGDTINFASSLAGQTITLGGSLNVNQNVTITAATTFNVVINGAGATPFIR